MLLFLYIIIKKKKNTHTHTHTNVNQKLVPSHKLGLESRCPFIIRLCSRIEVIYLRQKWNLHPLTLPINYFNSLNLKLVILVQ